MAKKRCGAGQRRVRGYTIQHGKNAGKRVHRYCRNLRGKGRRSRPLKNYISRRGTCRAGYRLVPSHPSSYKGKFVAVRTYCRKKRG